MAASGTNKPGTALTVLAKRLEVDVVELQDTLTQTVFKGANPAQMNALCIVANEYGLNPFVKELYAFPSQGGIVPMVSVDGWLRKINDHPRFIGMDIVYAEKTAKVGKSKECPEYIEVTIHRSDRPHTSSPIREYLDECYRDTQPWNQMTRRQLRHKAIMQAGRVVMGLHGIYDEDEANDILAREGKRIVKVGDDYEVIEADDADTGEIIGPDEYQSLRAEMNRTGLVEASVRKNLELKAKYTGELADMPLAVYEALMSGLSAMETVNPPDDDQPNAAPHEASGGDEEASADSGAALDQQTLQDAQRERAAADPEPPGRGPIRDASDPDRKPTANELKRLSAALGQVDAAAVKKYRAKFNGRSNKDLTHAEVDELMAWAEAEALS